MGQNVTILTHLSYYLGFGLGQPLNPSYKKNTFIILRYTTEKHTSLHASIYLVLFHILYDE